MKKLLKFAIIFLISTFAFAAILGTCSHKYIPKTLKSKNNIVPAAIIEESFEYGKQATTQTNSDTSPWINEIFYSHMFVSVGTAIPQIEEASLDIGGGGEWIIFYNKKTNGENNFPTGWRIERNDAQDNLYNIAFGTMEIPNQFQSYFIITCRVDLQSYTITEITNVRNNNNILNYYIVYMEEQPTQIQSVLLGFENNFVTSDFDTDYIVTYDFYKSIFLPWVEVDTQETEDIPLCFFSPAIFLSSNVENINVDVSELFPYYRVFNALNIIIWTNLTGGGGGQDYVDGQNSVIQNPNSFGLWSNSQYREFGEQQFNQGVIQGANNSISFSWLTNLFTIATNFCNIEILPNIKLIYLAGITILFGFVRMIIRWFK